MKSEGLIFVIIAFFFAFVAAVYGILSREWAGTTALALSAGLGALVGLYVIVTGSRLDPRPEDDPYGEVEDGPGEYGFFSPHSWWPLPTAASAAVVGAGLAFGLWLSAIGLVCLILCAVGFVFEYYRGPHAQ